MRNAVLTAVGACCCALRAGRNQTSRRGQARLELPRLLKASVTGDRRVLKHADAARGASWRLTGWTGEAALLQVEPNRRVVGAYPR